MSEPWMAALDDGLFIHQIFYNEATRAALDPHFIPLDNTENPRPDWYEFYVILDYFRRTPPQDGAWYGFLSPKFGAKTKYGGEEILRSVRKRRDTTDVSLPTYAWTQLCYFVNCFEQCEYFHPGTIAAARAFLAPRGFDLDALVSHTHNANYGNFIIAGAAYWRAWLTIAEDFWAYCEAPDSPLGRRIVEYGNGGGFAHTKVFIQERLPSIVLASNRFRTVSRTPPGGHEIDSLLFDSTPHVRRSLEAMDLLKQYYSSSGDYDFLRAYLKMRTRHPPRAQFPPQRS